MRKLVTVIAILTLPIFLLSCGSGGSESGSDASSLTPYRLPTSTVLGRVAGTLISPLGGENWIIGNAHMIRWNPLASYGTHVALFLYKTCSADSICYHSVITSSTPNDGNFVWTIPSSITPSSEYQMYITHLERCGDVYCSEVRDWGQLFTISSRSSSSSSSGSAFEGYVNKYGDLLAAYNSNSGGLSKNDWGKNHYCNAGLAEGRTYTGISSANCGSSSASGVLPEL